MADSMIYVGIKTRFALALTSLIIGVGTVFTGTMIFRLIPAEAASVYVLTLVLFYIGTGLCWVVVAGMLINPYPPEPDENADTQTTLRTYQ